MHVLREQGGKSPVPGRQWEIKRQKHDLNKHKAKALTAEASTEQHMGRWGLLRGKSGSNPLRDTLGISGVEDTKTLKTLFIQTKGSNLLANAHCPHLIYFYDNVIYVYQFRIFPKVVVVGF